MEKGSSLHFDKSLQTPLLLSWNCRRGTSLVCKACSGGDDACDADLKACPGMADMSSGLRGTGLDILGQPSLGPACPKTAGPAKLPEPLLPAPHTQWPWGPIPGEVQTGHHQSF